MSVFVDYRTLDDGPVAHVAEPPRSTDPNTDWSGRRRPGRSRSAGAVALGQVTRIYPVGDPAPGTTLAPPRSTEPGTPEPGTVGPVRRAAARETERSLRVAALLTQMANCQDPIERKNLESAVVVEHLNVAKSIASRYRGRGVERGDLEQLAYLGLVKAVSRWLPGLSDDFLQFAVPTISGEIKRYFRDHSWLVRPPRRVQELRAAISAAERDFQESGVLRPSDAMLAGHLGVRDVDVREARAAAGLCRPPSIDADSGAGLFIAQQWSGDDCMSAVDDRMSLDVVLKGLTPRERRVVNMRFNDGMSQARIGEVIGVSQMQVSRILRDVVSKLRDRWQQD